MKKRILSILLVVSMLMSMMIVTSAYTSNSTYSNGFYYEVISESEKTAKITGYSCDFDYVSCLTIPSELDGYTITTIGFCAFLFRENVGGIILPDTVTTIEDAAFAECYSLGSIEIPSSVKTIGVGCFNICRTLQMINVSPDNENYSSIDGVLFSKNKDTLIYYPNGKDATTYTIPDGVISIEGGAFFEQYQLMSVTISDSVTTIGEYAFADCFSLTDVYYTGTEEEWNDIDIHDWNEYLLEANIHYNYGDMMECPWESHNTVYLDETVEPTCTSAGYDVYWCDTCQDSFDENYVTELDHNFENGVCTVCNVLQEDCIETEHNYSRPCDLTWTIHKENATSITITFSDLTMTASYDRIDIYDGEDNLITIGDTWGGAMANRTMTVMGDTVKIRFTAYEDYYGEPIDYTDYGFKIINVVANYDAIENDGFEYEVLSEEEKTAVIYEYTGSATSIVIPSQIDGYTITTIGAGLFMNYESLVDITIPNTITCIEERAFIPCWSIENMYYTGTIDEWAKIEFISLQSNPMVYAENEYFAGELIARDIVLSQGIDSINSYAFAGSNIASITIPDGVKTIGDVAFGECTALTNVIIPNSVTEIGFDAFRECSSLTDVYYTGSEKQWNAIEIYDGNESLLDANIHYNYGNEILNDWILEGNKWAFYENGVKLTNQWKADSKGWCYLGADGYMVTNKWVADSKGWCYVGANGYCVTNQWVADSKGWCYLGADGRMVTNKWVKDSKGWCYVGADGYCVTDKWVADSKGWCYLGADGRMVTNKWVKDSKGWCYVGADGYCLTNAWKADSKGWCYLDANGRMVISNWVKDGGKWYYLDADGYMVTGTKTIGGKTYKFASNGVWIA